METVKDDSFPLTGCGKSLNRDDSPPQGLKPSLILHDLRGAKAPLYHSAAGFRDFFRSLFSRAALRIKLTSPLRLRSGQAFRRCGQRLKPIIRRRLRYG